MKIHCDLQFVHKGLKAKSMNQKLNNLKVQKMGNISYVIISDIYVGLIIKYAS